MRLPPGIYEMGRVVHCCVASWHGHRVSGLFSFAVPHRGGKVYEDDRHAMIAAVDKYGCHTATRNCRELRRAAAVCLDDVGPLTCPAYVANPWAVSIHQGVGLSEAVGLILSQSPQQSR